MVAITLILLLISSFPLRIAAITLEDCRTKMIPLSYDELQQQHKMSDFPLSPYALAYSLFPQDLHDYSSVDRARIKYSPESVSSSASTPVDMHIKYKVISGKNSPQFKVGRNGDTAVLYFMGTQNIKDVITDFNVEPKRKDFEQHEEVRAGARDRIRDPTYGSRFINVHSGIAKIIDDEGFLSRLQKELLWIFTPRGRGRAARAPTRFIISGHSLGGGYAMYLFLKLYVVEPLLLQRRGFNLLPTHTDAVTVITYGAPFILQATKNIPHDFPARIFNFVNYRDPVPMLLAGPLADLESTTIKGAMAKDMSEFGGYLGCGMYIVLYHDDSGAPYVDGSSAAAERTPKALAGSLKRWYRVFGADEPSIMFGNECFHLRTPSYRSKRKKVATNLIKYHVMNVYRNTIWRGPFFIYMSITGWGPFAADVHEL